MKNLLLILLLTCCWQSSFAQELAGESSKIINKESLMLKHKNQKRLANILLISGGSLIVISGIVGIGETAAIYTTEGENLDNIFTATATIATIGILMSAASIPFYISAGSNKRKAAALSFQQQNIPYLKNNTVANSIIPSVSLKIKL